MPPFALAVMAASWERGGVLLIWDGWEIPALLPTCLLSSKHAHGLSQQAAVTAASRDFNELADFLQSTYLSPAAPPPPSASLLPLPSWLLPGKGREELFIVCLLKMKGFYILMSAK